MTDSSIQIRSAIASDAPAIFTLIEALAEYEKLSHLVSGNATQLLDHLFGDRPYVEAIVAETEDEEIIGFALFFYNYSTFLTQPGIYLEDLFVLPEYRGRKIGKALLSKVAAIALERGCGRYEWTVLDWNEPSIKFYEQMGATVLPDWKICRVTGDALQKMATLNDDPA